MISHKMNKSSKSLEYSALTQGSHSTSPSSDTSSLSIQALQSLLNKKLKFHLLRLVQSPEFSKKVLLTFILSIFQKTLKKILKSWDFESKKKKRFLNGLEILKKQEKKKTDSQKKQRFKESGLKEIQQEKALNSLKRIIGRKKFEFKGEGFKVLIENWYFYNKVFGFFKGKQRDRVRSIVGWWRRYVEWKKDRRVKGAALIRGLGMKKVVIWFKGLVERDGRLHKIKGKLACLKVEKIVFGRTQRVFAQLKRKRSGKRDFGVLMIYEVLMKLKTNAIKTGFQSIMKYLYKTKYKKSNQATQVLKNLVIKKCFNTFTSLILASSRYNLIKISHLTKILIDIEEKTKEFAMLKLKNSRISKFYIFPTRVILNKLQNLIKNSKKKALWSLRAHKNCLRHSLSLQILSYLTTERHKFLKKSSFKTLKVYFNHKKQQYILWKMKFYQLEGLVQHKKEEVSLKLRFKHFLQWKNTSNLISRHSKKQIKRQIRIFTLSLSSIIQNFTFFHLSSTFLIMKHRFLHEKGIIWGLEKMYSRRLKSKYFEKMKNKTLNFITSPKSMRRSVFTYGPSQRRSSPYGSATRLSSPGFPKNKATVQTRFAFYTTKKSSLDCAAYKHSGMVKMLNIIDKGPNLNNFDGILK